MMPIRFNLRRRTSGTADQGFSLVELMVVLGILLVVGAAVMQLMFKMTMSQSRISSRASLHSAVRSATAIMQQEISQAGRIDFPAPVTLNLPVVANPGVPSAAAVTSLEGIFVGIILAVDSGANREIVTVTAVDAGATTITAIFDLAHAAGAVVVPVGGFPTGIVAPNQTGVGITGNTSTANILKLYGDINDDGNMVYIEYTCDTVNGFLYRNSMPITQAPPSPAPNATMALLENVMPNPGGTPCFSYEQRLVPPNYWYVTNVAVTLTVNPEYRDLETGRLDAETKALLNVSPRNIYEMWQMASLNPVSSYIQPTPPSVIALLP